MELSIEIPEEELESVIGDHVKSKLGMTIEVNSTSINIIQGRRGNGNRAEVKLTVGEPTTKPAESIDEDEAVMAEEPAEAEEEPSE